MGKGRICVLLYMLLLFPPPKQAVHLCFSDIYLCSWEEADLHIVWGGGGGDYYLS